MRNNEQLAARIRAVEDVTENMRISAVRMPLHAREDIYELVSPETARIPQARGMWDSCRCYSYLKGMRLSAAPGILSLSALLCGGGDS